MIRTLRRILVISMIISIVFVQRVFAGPIGYNNYSIREDDGQVKVYETDSMGSAEPEITGDISKVQKVEGESITISLLNDIDCTFIGSGRAFTNGIDVNKTSGTKPWNIIINDIEVNKGSESVALTGASVNGEGVNFYAGDITANNESGPASTTGLGINKGSAIVKNITVKGNSNNTFGIQVNSSSSTTVEENVIVNNGSIISSSGSGNIINILGTAEYTNKNYVLVSAGSEDDITLNVWKTDGDVKITMDSGLTSNEFSDDKVNYIIKDKDGTVTYNHMTLSGGKFVDIKDRDGNIKHYYTAVEGYITVTVSEGYKLNSTTDCAGSGRTYRVTIPEGGGVTLEAIIEEIQRHSDNSTSSVSYTQGWTQSGNNWQYVKTDGTFARNEWLQIEVNGVKKWYHFGDDTMMDTGWLLDKDGSWYYLSKENDQNVGVMQTGWMTDPYDGHRYYLDPVTGKMLIGWHVIDGKRYYFNEHVPSASGWTQDEKGNWVYSKQSVIPLGAMIKK